jgi:DNA polymerase III delta prime subunit
MAGSTSIMPSPPRNPPTKTQQLWRCDVCHTASFASFQEACIHEDLCREEQTREGEEHQNHEPPTHANPKRHPFFGGVPKPRGASTTPAFVTAHKMKRKPSKANLSLPHKVVERAARKDVSLTTEVTPVRHSTPNPRTSSLDDGIGKRSHPPLDADMDSVGQVYDVKDYDTHVPTSKSRAKKTCKHKTECRLSPLVFGKTKEDSKILMAEQRQAEFQAKRRLKTLKDRERQLKRQRAADDATGSTASSHDPTAKQYTNERHPCNQQKNVVAHAARFPTPSHVIPADRKNSQSASDSKAPYSWLSLDALKQTRAAISQLQYAGCDRNMSENFVQTKHSENEATLRLLPVDGNSFAGNFSPKDPIKLTLQAHLVPPLEPASDTDTSLWSDRYGIRRLPEDLCGASIENAALDLAKFVQEWKLERQKAHECRAENQRRFQKNVSRANKVVYKDDRDLWEDSDEEGPSLPSLCLITGPVGSGKTSLVHAVAQQHGCPILEINTTERRGASALRKTIEEATQSHSTMDLLHTHQANVFATAKKGPNTDCNDKSVNSMMRGSTLTVILIDEVDLLFEAQGDNGFWSALCDLQKRSKCPIILTSNRFPDCLNSPSFRFHHIVVDMPHPRECMSKLRRILENERFSLCRNTSDSSLEKMLLELAELCRSDMRRMCLELQLFASSDASSFLEAATAISIEPEETSFASLSSRSPKIDAIQPSCVPSDTFSFVTVTGKNFLSLVASPSLGNGGFPVGVKVGDQVCFSSRIMNDSTILSVVPPCRLPLCVGSCGMVEGCNNRSLESRYAPVVVYGLAELGCISTTFGHLIVDELTLGTISSLHTICNLEYCLPTPIKTEQNEDEGGGLEEKNITSIENVPSSLDCLMLPNTLPRVFGESKLPARLLKEGLDAWNLKYELSRAVENYRPVLPALEMEEASFDAEINSDSRLLEDLGSLSTPFLSGAVRGFGFDLTEAFPKYNNEKSKPYVEYRPIVAPLSINLIRNFFQATRRPTLFTRLEGRCVLFWR